APQCCVLGMGGHLGGGGLVAARRRGWDRKQASRVFVGAAIGFAALTAVASAVAVHASWNAKRQQRAQVAGALQQAGASPDDRLMSIDAAGYRYDTGHGGVV